MKRCTALMLCSNEKRTSFTDSQFLYLLLLLLVVVVVVVVVYMTATTAETRSFAFLMQRLSVVVRRGNVSGLIIFGNGTYKKNIATCRDQYVGTKI